MRIPIFIVVQFAFLTIVWGQTPHGESLKIDCASCHTSESWTVETRTIKFDHSTTGFALTMRHANIDCKQCHLSLVFSDVKTTCVSCHFDIHQQTVGNDCARCHTTENWLVDRIAELHQDNGFPLIGVHTPVSCTDCHMSETALRFDRLGNDCRNCHLEAYNATTQPDHKAAGYSTECSQCHSFSGDGWGLSNFIHDFFPLTMGHAINDCNRCHTNGAYSNISPECKSCHQSNFDATTNPNHSALGFSTDCALCHNTAPGWQSSTFSDHDGMYFPIYSGKHKGEWGQCTDCHTNPGNYTTFSCTDCHEHNNASKLANKHDEVSGYQFNSQACYTCHPQGH